jgi:hypothetical protein
MEFTLFVLEAYSAIITVLYVHQKSVLKLTLDTVSEMQRIIDTTDPYVKKLTSEVEARKEELRIERSINKAQAETLRRLQETLSPASFDSILDEEKNTAKHAPEETSGSFL